MILTCEAPRCDAVAAELVVVRDPLGLMLDGLETLRLVLCASCAGQVIDAARPVSVSLDAYAVG